MKDIEKEYEKAREDYLEKFNSLPFDTRRFLGVYFNMALIQAIGMAENELKVSHKRQIGRLEEWKTRLKKEVYHTSEQINIEESESKAT